MIDKSFGIVLRQIMDARDYTPKLLSKQSGISEGTLKHWLQEHVHKPQQWQSVISLAKAMNLDEESTNVLLAAAGKDSIEQLVAGAGPEQDLVLLAPWIEVVRQRYAKVPFQVIPDLPYFTGRTRELQALKKALKASRHTSVYSLEGPSGVGKTVLAAHLAYQIRPLFPDGVLWARLDTSDLMSILSAFALAYGQDVHSTTDLESRSQVVRGILASKRALIILDNVRNSRQVKAILPPTGACAVLITTQSRSLSITRGAHRFTISPFKPETQESLMLFAKIIGEDRAEQERSTLIELADFLGHLPLALSIAAGQMSNPPYPSASDVLVQLRQQRLNTLETDDESVQLSFATNYMQLHSEQQRFLTALGVFGGDDFSVDAVAYITQMSLDDAQFHLEKLVALSLIRPGKSGRYQFHPLIRLYIQNLGHDLETTNRMIEFFSSFVEYHKTEYGILDVELRNIFSALDRAITIGASDYFTRGINELYPFLQVRGLYDEAEVRLRQARYTAQLLEDSKSLAITLRNLGRIAVNRGNFIQAEGYFQEALAAARSIGDQGLYGILFAHLGTAALNRADFSQAEKYYQEGLAWAQESKNDEAVADMLMGLGAVADSIDDYQQAEKYYHDSLALARKLSHYERISVLLSNLGGVVTMSGDLARAEKYLLEGLDVAQKQGHRENISLLLTNLGELAYECKNYQQAESWYQEGLKIARDIGHRKRICVLLNNLAALSAYQGDYSQAEIYFTESLMLAREMGQRWLISACLVGYGEALLKQQKLASSDRALLEVLEISLTIGNQEFRAAALYGLAQIAMARQNFADAHRYGAESLAIFEHIHHKKAAEVARWLTTIDKMTELGRE